MKSTSYGADWCAMVAADGDSSTLRGRAGVRGPGIHAASGPSGCLRGWDRGRVPVKKHVRPCLGTNLLDRHIGCQLNEVERAPLNVNHGQVGDDTLHNALSGVRQGAHVYQFERAILGD